MAAANAIRAICQTFAQCAVVVGAFCNATNVPPVPVVSVATVAEVVSSARMLWVDLLTIITRCPARMLAEGSHT